MGVLGCACSQYGAAAWGASRSFSFDKKARRVQKRYLASVFYILDIFIFF